MRVLLALVLAMSGAAASAQGCDPAPGPVLALAQGSRYAAEDETRSEIDAEAEAEAEAALEPIDDFLRDLTEAANDALGSGDRAAAACTVAQVAEWARAGALSDLASETANLTLGSRVAGFGLVLMQVLPLAEGPEAEEAKAWLGALVAEQMRFWEEDAPDGAARGNLRAWAALGAAAAAEVTGDPLARAWAAWSVGHVLCTAAPDGSLPQEMGRGRLALHYQLHALAPLVVATALLDRQGVDLRDACDGALGRVVAFTVADLDDGAATAALAGEAQSFFDGSGDAIEEFHLAWAEAWLALGGDPGGLDARVRDLRPLSYSKLGGDQTLLWGR